MNRNRHRATRARLRGDQVRETRRVRNSLHIIRRDNLHAKAQRTSRWLDRYLEDFRKF